MSLEGEGASILAAALADHQPYDGAIVVDGAVAGVAGDFFERLFLGRIVSSCFAKHSAS